MGWSNAFEKKAVAEAVSAAIGRPQVPLAQVDWAKLVTLDFETYWDQDYTLRKMSTSEYVRDKRFKAHMVGIKIGKRKTKVVPAAKIKTALMEIDWKNHDLLCHHTQFDGLILSHHYGIVPRRYYDTLSMARGLHSNDIGADLDSVAVFYGVGNKVLNILDQSKGVRTLPKQLYGAMAEYCGVDVDLTHQIFGLMCQQYPQAEMDLIHLTVAMFCDPVLKVDIPLAERALAIEVERKRRLFADIIEHNPFDWKQLVKKKEERLAYEAGDDEFRRIMIAKKIIGSNEKYADLLRKEGIEPPVKISPAWIKASKEERETKEKWAYAFASTDEEFVALLEDPSERVRDLVEARLAVKSNTNETRARRFIQAGIEGSLAVYLAYYRAHTGRWGGGNKMNMQNLMREDPRDPENTGLLRKSILAPKGYQVVVGDSGQIEARINGWLWGQDDLLEDFRKADAKLDRDAYCKFGDLIYKRTITKDDKIERHVAKTSVLGLGFQMGAPKFQATLAKGANGGPPVYFDLETCQQIVSTYRKKNHRIKWGWDKCMQIIRDMYTGRSGSYKCLSWEKETIWLPNGMSLHYPGLKCETNDENGFEEWSYKVKDGRTKIYGGKLCENIVQALARIVVAAQMLEFAKKHRVVNMTHDEIVGIAKTAQADKAYQHLMKLMQVPPAWCSDIPLNSEGGYAPNYSK